MNTFQPVMRQAIQPIVPYNLIQGIRLVHALMESDFEIYIPMEHVGKFTKLQDRFGAKFHEGVYDAIPIVSLQLNHKNPVTSIGSIERPLIFPHAIVRHCKTVWKHKRNIRVSFAGLITSQRQAVISKYCRENLGKNIKELPNLNPLPHRLHNKVRKLFGKYSVGYSTKINELTLWSSLRGRQFPVKAWDDDYFELLSRSQFVLCPSGDYVWSYRFFEAVLCGAIPIVEEPCEAYNGFIFHTMDDRLSNLKWSREASEHNYDICCNRITVPIHEINNELAILLSQLENPA